MIINKITINSFCILKKTISISISADDTRREVIEELQKITKKNRKFTIEATSPQRTEKSGEPVTINMNAKIPATIGIRDNINFTLHTDILKYIVFRLLEINMNNCSNIVLKFVSEKEKELQSLLKKVAKKYRISEENALLEATSFPSRKNPGEVVPGKTNIYELSEKRKTVVTDILQKKLKEPIKHKTL